jgi:hypothetical protein
MRIGRRALFLFGSTAALLGCGGATSQRESANEGGSVSSGGAHQAGNRAEANGGTSGAAAASTGGTAGVAAGRTEAGAGALPVEPPADVVGRWAQFGTDDANAVELVQNAGVLSGSGCLMGLPAPTDPDHHYCADLVGKVQGQRVTFAYEPDGAHEGADLWVSADGRRMAGRHSFDGTWWGPVGWLRFGKDEIFLPNFGKPEEPITLALRAHVGIWALEQVSGPPAIFVGRTDQGAYLNIPSDVKGGFVFGTLGAFWQDEMTWNEAEQTLSVGPVPETVPGLPTQLLLHFEGGSLQAVEATRADGKLLSFAAKPFVQR